MLLAVLEIVILSALSGFFIWKGVALIDFLLDYNQFWWKVRYKKAEKSAKKVGMVDYLWDTLDSAKEAGDNKANVMAAAYQAIAERYYPFKLWICIYCMTIRIGAIVGLGVAGILWMNGYGYYSALYFFCNACMIWAYME